MKREGGWEDNSGPGGSYIPKRGSLVTTFSRRPSMLALPGQRALNSMEGKGRYLTTHMFQNITRETRDQEVVGFRPGGIHGPRGGGGPLAKYIPEGHPRGHHSPHPLGGGGTPGTDNKG